MSPSGQFSGGHRIQARPGLGRSSCTSEQAGLRAFQSGRRQRLGCADHGGTGSGSTCHPHWKSWNGRSRMALTAGFTRLPSPESPSHDMCRGNASICPQTFPVCSSLGHSPAGKRRWGVRLFPLYPKVACAPQDPKCVVEITLESFSSTRQGSHRPARGPRLRVAINTAINKGEGGRPLAA